MIARDDEDRELRQKCQRLEEAAQVEAVMEVLREAGLEPATIARMDFLWIRNAISAKQRQAAA